MSAIEAIAVLGPSSLSSAASAFPATGSAAARPAETASPPASAGGFGSLLSQSIGQLNDKVNTADRLVRSFALDESSVPIHQVTIALEEARLAVELATQVRTRLVEAYREIMNTQL